MSSLISDPTIYWVLAAAYVVGFWNVDASDYQRRRYALVADGVFYVMVAGVVAVFALHGMWAGLAAVGLAWCMAAIGARRSVLAERNAIFDSLLFTAPISAVAPEPAMGQRLPRPARAAREAAHRTPRLERWLEQIDAAVASLLGNIPVSRGSRLNILGVAVDLAASITVFFAMALLLA